MIIKVQVDKNDSWKFYDSAREVAFERVKAENAPTLGNGEEEQDNFTVEIEGDSVTKLFIRDELPEYVLLIHFFDHNMHRHELYTDAETYLLNDNGKTIERLY